MSHRLSRGKRRCLRDLFKAAVKRRSPRGAEQVARSRIDYMARFPDVDVFGKTARREGRHYDGKKMSPPCDDCGKRKPFPLLSARASMVLCQRCTRRRLAIRGLGNSITKHAWREATGRGEPC